MGVTEELCRYAIETRYDDLGEKALKIARERFLETIGVTVAGAREPGGSGSRMVEFVRGMGGPPVSTVVGGGFRTFSANAALANGTSAITLDLDDATQVPLNHQSVALIPAMLALAEQTGASGKEVLEAYCMGYEVGTRIGLGLGMNFFTKMGFHPVALWLTLGVTVACGKLLGLGLDQMKSALGTAATTACGLRRSFGTDARCLHGGMSAKNGIMAAMLAKEGFTGHSDVLDDPDSNRVDNMYFSFPIVFAGPGNYNLKTMVDGLGKELKFVSAPLLTRYHPGCVVGNTFAELTLDMIQKHGITAEQVESLECGATGAGLEIGTYHEPRTSAEAHYSIEYFVAAAVLDRKVWIEQFREDRVNRPDIREMMKRVHLYEHTDFPPEATITDRFWNVRLAIKLKDGREYKGKLERTKGHPDTPLRREDLVGKYRDCTRGILTDKQTEQSIELVENLAEAKDVTRLMAIIAAKPHR